MGRASGLAARPLVVALTLLIAAPASAQDRTPSGRQNLVDLARTLGESHALGRLCQGRQDQFWYDRMRRMLEVEAADQGFRTRLVLAFNAAYNSGRALYPKCTDAARAEARRIAGVGQALAAGLAKP